MEVVLQIIQGPEKGQEFRFQESDNLLVGRKDPTSKAHVNLSPEDEYVSRHHFMIEVRPPNCLIRDNGSANGTFVRRKGRDPWERTQETNVEDGDEIKVGRTVLRVRIAMPEPVGIGTKIYEAPVAAPSGPQQAEAQPEVFCIRCGEPLAITTGHEADTVRGLDFMCSKCRELAEADLAQEAAAKAAARYACWKCGSDVTKTANADGRAAELSDVALYLCRPCADRSREISAAPIGAYVLLKALGKGGMGIVYKVWHQQTGRLAALKLMLPQAKCQKGLILKFKREMSIMGELKHPGVVRLYEIGNQGADPYFVCELATEGSLERYVSKSGETLLDPPDAARLIAVCMYGLDFFHEKGYVHRDIKPENILLQNESGEIVPKLADFGLARSFEKHGGTISRTGEFAGTYCYMPPEQILAFRKCPPTVDIYAFGVALYYLLTARFPLDFPVPYEPIVRAKKDPVRMILDDLPRPVRDRRRDLPSALCAVVDKAVAKDPRQRYQSAKEFQAAIRMAVKGS